MSTATTRPPLARLTRVALVVAILASIGGGIAAFLHPEGLAEAWFFGVFVMLQPALGSLILLLIYRMTGGQWGRSLQPFLHAGALLAPIIWLLLIPLLFLPDLGTMVGEREHAATGALAAYESQTGVAIRYVVIGVLLALISWGARRAGGSFKLRWVGPVGLIALVFALHLAAVDWLFALAPGWYSTGFPLIWMGGHTVSGLAAAIAAGIFAGRPAAATGTSGRHEGIDWGNLLLATVLFWSYVSFVHLLIMWQGNIALEVAWYIDRATPGWGAVIGVIAVFHLFLPLLMLFFRAFKRSSRALGGLAGTLVGLQAMHTCWLIFPSLHPGAAMLVLAALFALAAFGVFFAFYARLAGRLGEVR
jgi:hypothetical protein